MNTAKGFATIRTTLEGLRKDIEEVKTMLHETNACISELEAEVKVNGLRSQQSVGKKRRLNSDSLRTPSGEQEDKRVQEITAACD